MTELDELTKKGRFKHIILWLTLLFIIIGLVWAYFAQVDEVTTGTGKVIPSSKVQVIQNLEGGIVKSILVKEGERVEKGQILMVLDDVRFASEYKANLEKRLLLQVKIARLNAEINEKPLVIPKELEEKIPTIVQNAKILYQSRMNEMQQLKLRKSLLEKEISMNKPLVKSGAVSEVEVLRLQQALSELTGKILAFRSEALKELSEVNKEYANLKEEAKTLKDRLERTDVRSPVKGIVKQVHVATIGGVIKAGMPLIEVVPLEDTLLVEVQIDPDDIGFIQVGQEAMVKITAYDYSIYGGLDGKVEHISADTSTDEEGKSYYEVWVRTQKAYLGTKNNPLQIIPGMQASVSILTGKKSILTYLLKPVLKAKEKALRER